MKKTIMGVWDILIVAATLLVSLQVAAEDAYDWLEEIGLRPQPRVSTQVVDTTATDGVEQSGILYQPESGDDYSKPASMLLYGYSGDNMRSASQWLPVRLAVRPTTNGTTTVLPTA